MKRYANIIRLRPEKLDEYKELHKAVWQSVLDRIKTSNITNYSIFYRDGLLFSYYEYVGTDHAADMAAIASDPMTQKWWELTTPCQQPLETCQEGEWWASMEEFFYTK